MQGERKSTHLYEIWIPLAILLVGTLLFWLFPIDLKLADHFHDAGQVEGPDNGWTQRQDQPWKFLYDYGTWPGIGLGIGAIITILLSLGISKLKDWRKHCLFLMLAMLIGPGVFVNAIFKDHWGRPRPRAVENFGGDYAFEQVLEYDASSPGKSFPCGHASTGFYLLSVFLLLRHRHRKAAWISLIGSLILGILIGIARIAQGGHFASDVLWAAAMCWFVSLALYYLLGLHRPDEETGFDRLIGRAPKRFFMIAGSVILAGIIAILLATPHEKDQYFAPSENRQAGTSRQRLSVKLEAGDVTLSFGNELGIRSHAKGFGVPGSQMKSIFHEKKDEAGEDRFQLKMRKSGYFTELHHDLKVTVDGNRPNYLKFEIEQGSLNLELLRSRSVRLDLGDTTFSAPEGWFRETKPGIFENGKSPETTILLRLQEGGLTVVPISSQK